MTPLETLEATLKAGTVGPFHVEPWDGYEMRHQILAPLVKRTTDCGQRESAELVFARCSNEEDAALIVAAVNALPALVAVAKAAKEYRDWAGSTSIHDCQSQGLAAEKLDAALKELEK